MAEGAGGLNGAADGAGVDIEEAFGAELSPDESRIRGWLLDICEADMRNLVDDKNRLKPVHLWPAREARAIESWNYDEGTGRWRVKLRDPIKAAEQLARLDGLYDGKEDARGPVEAALDQVPRGTLKAMLSRLGALGATGGGEHAVQAAREAGPAAMAQAPLADAAADAEFEPI